MPKQASLVLLHQHCPGHHHTSMQSCSMYPQFLLPPQSVFQFLYCMYCQTAEMQSVYTAEHIHFLLFRSPHCLQRSVQSAYRLLHLTVCHSRLLSASGHIPVQPVKLYILLYYSDYPYFPLIRLLPHPPCPVFVHLSAYFLY